MDRRMKRRREVVEKENWQTQSAPTQFLLVIYSDLSLKSTFSRLSGFSQSHHPARWVQSHGLPCGGSHSDPGGFCFKTQRLLS